MINIGGSYRKTETIKIQDLSFNEKHFNHLLRGYFDGDGSIGYSNYIKEDGTRSLNMLKFTGSKNLIKSLKSYLNIKSSLSQDCRKDNCFDLNVYGDEMRDLLGCMYKDSNIYLERKRDAYIKGYI